MEFPLERKNIEENFFFKVMYRFNIFICAYGIVHPLTSINTLDKILSKSIILWFLANLLTKFSKDGHKSAKEGFAKKCSGLIYFCVISNN